MVGGGCPDEAKHICGNQIMMSSVQFTKEFQILLISDG